MHLVFLLALIALFLCTPPKVLANSVNIDEFYALGDPDWVVVYNPGSSSVDLAGWQIRDNTESNKIELNGYICAGSYRKFEFSNRLNNSGDKIRLIDQGGTSVEEIEYFSGTIPAHQTNESTKKLQSTLTWQVNTAPNPVDDNSCNPVPSPTPTVESANTSSSTSSQKSPTPTPKSSPKASPKKSPSPTPKVLSASTQGATTSASAPPTIEDSISQTNPNEFAVPTPTPQNQEPSKKVAGILIGAGAVLVLISVFGYFFYKSKDEKETDTN